MELNRCLFSYQERTRIFCIVVSNNSKLEIIIACGNKISADLGIFSHLTSLQKLDLSGFSNNFYGSLEALKGCKNLNWLCIDYNQRVKGGLEQLPTDELDYFDCRNTDFVEMIIKVRFESNAEGVKQWQKWWQSLSLEEREKRKKEAEKPRVNTGKTWDPLGIWETVSEVKQSIDQNISGVYQYTKDALVAFGFI